MKPTTAFVPAAAIEWKFSGYGVAAASTMTDAEPWQRAQEYRRATAARMAPLDRKELRSRLPAGEYHLSRKVDGEFTVLVFRGGEACTVNPGGTVRLGLPLLAEAAERLRSAGVRSALIAGELYYRRPDGGRERVHDVCRAARQPASIHDLDNLCFAAFDIIELDGAFPTSREGTLGVIAKLFPDSRSGQRIHAVEAAPAGVRSVEEIEGYFQRWVDEGGGEGLVLRSDSAGRFKVKPRHTLDVVVVGFTESLGERQGMLHDLLVAVMRQDGSFHLLGQVGTGFSDEERRALLSDLKDRIAHSDYVEPSSEHVAYKMVCPELVIEISCLDLISQTTRGGTIDRMTLSWERPPVGSAPSATETGRYVPLRRLPLASMISPVFLRRRDDKRADPTDIRLAQVSELVEIPKADLDARNVTLPQSQLLRREVYTKTLKGQTAVRKLLLWQTNKQPSGDFPAYVLHLTDFSPTRKDPLQREIRVSNSQAQIEALYTAFHKEYIVRGWLHADAPPAKP